MTKQEAIKFDDELKTKLMKVSTEFGMDEKTGADIVERYIMVIPDDDRKGMIFLGNAAVSYKLGNVRLDLKKAIVAGLELVAAVNHPKNLFNYLQLVIVAALFVQKSTGRVIGKPEAYIVYFLHIKNSYKIGMDEDLFVKEFLTWYQNYSGQVVAEFEIETAINNLYNQKILDINSGKIYLKEQVIGNI